jgi:hypothetical protein
MAWTEVHQSLCNSHPKVLQVADALNCAEVAVIGSLICLWTWAIDNAPSGVLAPNARVVARAAQWYDAPGLYLQALIDAHLLDTLDDGRLYIHDWQEYAGRLIEKRRVDAERKRAGRQQDIPRISTPIPADVQRMSSGCPEEVQRMSDASRAGVPTQPTVPTEPSMSAGADVLELTLPDESPIHTAELLNAYTEDFETFWLSYPRNEKKLAAFNVWKALSKLHAHLRPDPADLITASQNYAVVTHGREKSKVMLGSTFLSLKDRNWEDYCGNGSQVPRNGKYHAPEKPAHKAGDGKPEWMSDGDWRVRQEIERLKKEKAAK